MARSVKAPGRRRRDPPPLDELGGTADGGLAILNDAGELIHMTPARVAGSLRYFLARVQLHDAQGLPERLALTSALVGEGVTYVTRSLAAAIAYDTEASVCIVDLTFRRPATPGAEGKNAKRRRTKPASPTPARRSEIPVEVTSEDPAEVDTTDAPDPDAAPDDPAVGDETVTGTAVAEQLPAEPVPAVDETPRQLTLADAIEHGAHVDDIIIPTSNPRLCMIAAGGVPVARRPALAQGRPLATVLDQLDERFDHVLLDIPPVLVSSDAMNLSQLADACVLVVRQGATSESQVEAALDELQGGEMLGVILNRFEQQHPETPASHRRHVMVGGPA